MRKRITWFVIITLICAFFTITLIRMNRFFQPQVLSIQNGNLTLASSDFDSKLNYTLGGDLYCYPGMLLAPGQLAEYKDAGKLIDNNDFLVSSECLKDGFYQSTVTFTMSLPNENTYALLIPGFFPEYTIYVNGALVAASPKYTGSNSPYPSNFVLVLPYDVHGQYRMVMNLSKDPNVRISATRDVLLGSASRLTNSYANSIHVSMLFVAFIFFTGIFYCIQYVTMRKDRILFSFILLSFCAMLRALTLDDLILTQIFPSLSIEFIHIYRTIVSPLTLLVLMYYTYRMFSEVFPVKAGLLLMGVQILVTLQNIFIKSPLIPSRMGHYLFLMIFGLCLLTSFMAMLKNIPYWTGFTISLELLLCSSLVTEFTALDAIPAKYTHAYSFIGFAVMQITMLAKKYAAADHEEEYYRVEMTKTLETMQSSENAFLNAQMKPHFLYNTLNTIADLCVTSPPKAKKLISSLSDYLKQILNIDNTSGVVPLKRELELVTAYTTIEKERFPSINFFNDYPIRLPKVDIPPLTLQPLIENAIKHGLRKSSKPGAIILKIRDTGNEVLFSVSDNGMGMSAENVEKLFNIPSESQSIGIYNIDRRLVNLYGKGLSINSTVGLGTCVSFSVPKNKV